MATIRKTLAFAIAAGAAMFVTAQTQASPRFMETGGRTTQPVGHYELCQRLPVECAERTPAQAPVKLTRELWSQIIEVNNLVNTMVAPRTDMEMWGREEVWSYPTNGLGDCEDYVLEKRLMLMQKAHIPAGNLLITVVRQPDGAGHAVLTVETSLGDFILDNLEPRVLAWEDTDYQYPKRQSDRNSGVWVAIDDPRQILVGSVRK